MTAVEFPFEYHEHGGVTLSGALELDAARSYDGEGGRPCAYRAGRVGVAGGAGMEVVLVHGEAPQGYLYLHRTPLSGALLSLLGVRPIGPLPTEIELPGQLVFGAQRTRLVGRGVNDVLRAPPLYHALAGHPQEEIVSIPILREGIKYQVAEALHDVHGRYCDEIVTDSHHVPDPSVPVYARRVVTDIFKDRDLTAAQRGQVRVAVVGDSVASGIILFGLLEHVAGRYPALERVEVVAPFVTLRSLARIAKLWRYPFAIRVHAFETVLNALPPDHYWSAHYAEPALHFDPELEARYNAWWGADDEGRPVGETACAGYGWSEVFFNPRKQVAMIQAELGRRNGADLRRIVERNLNRECGATVVERLP
jgi:hypothetical protein